MRYATCRRCGGQVQIAKSAKRGLRFPLEVWPDDDYGNVLVDGVGRAHVFADARAARKVRDENPDSDLATSASYVPHAAVCGRIAAAREPERVASLV